MTDGFMWLHNRSERATVRIKASTITDLSKLEREHPKASTVALGITVDDD